MLIQHCRVCSQQKSSSYQTKNVIEILHQNEKKGIQGYDYHKYALY